MNKKEYKQAKEFFEKETELINKEYELIKKIINARNEQNLSQRKLCEMVGIKQPSLVRIENHVNSPSIKTILKILEPLGLTLEIKKIAK